MTFWDVCLDSGRCGHPSKSKKSTWPRGWQRNLNRGRTSEVSNNSSRYADATASLHSMCFNQNLRSQMIIQTTRQSTRYHGGDFAPSPGPSEAWRAWKKGCMAPSSCLREPACMRCCVWDVAQSTNTVHRKGPVLGTVPGVSKRWKPNRSLGTPRIRQDYVSR